MLGGVTPGVVTLPVPSGGGLIGGALGGGVIVMAGGALVGPVTGLPKVGPPAGVPRVGPAARGAEPGEELRNCASAGPATPIMAAIRKMRFIKDLHEEPPTKLTTPAASALRQLQVTD
jgi:hypothetical protein